jgi:chromosome segregation ATPase
MAEVFWKRSAPPEKPPPAAFLEIFMKRLCSLFAFAFAIALFVCVASSNAQQTEGRKRTPRLTTDDVMTTKTAKTTETPVVTVEGSSKKAGDAVKSANPQQDAAPDADAKAPAGKNSADEKAWREQVAKAREQAESLERSAEEAELHTTELRNSLGVAGQDAKSRNAIAAEMDQAGKQVTELKNQARSAKAELQKLLAVGIEKGFTEAQGPKATTSEGKANSDYYKARYAKLQQAIQDAERRVQLYENRVRSLNEMITNPNRDRFSGSQLQQDRDEAQQKADEAHTALEKAQTDLEKLMTEARAAGIPPGVFR